MRPISREVSRRLTLPTLIRMLSPIGKLCGFTRYPDHVSISLATEDELTLRFNDEDNAKDEGYTLLRNEIEVTGEIKICSSEKCCRGCGCGCVRDLGYIDSDTQVSPKHVTCLPTHGEVRAFEYDAPVYSLRTLRKMANDLVDCYLSSMIASCLR